MSTPTPTYAGLARLFWMFAGPMLLAMCGFKVASQKDGWYSISDGVYFLVLAALPLCRWLEFRGSPQTSDGEPATVAHLRQYSIVVAIVGVVAWAVANLIGNQLLTR